MPVVCITVGIQSPRSNASSRSCSADRSDPGGDGGDNPGISESEGGILTPIREAQATDWFYDCALAEGSDVWNNGMYLESPSRYDALTQFEGTSPTSKESMSTTEFQSSKSSIFDLPAESKASQQVDSFAHSPAPQESEGSTPMRTENDSNSKQTAGSVSSSDSSESSSGTSSESSDDDESAVSLVGSDIELVGELDMSQEESIAGCPTKHAPDQSNS